MIPESLTKGPSAPEHLGLSSASPTHQHEGPLCIRMHVHCPFGLRLDAGAAGCSEGLSDLPAQDHQGSKWGPGTRTWVFWLLAHCPRGKDSHHWRNSGDFSTESGGFLLARKTRGLAHRPRDRDLGRTPTSGFLKALSSREKPPQLHLLVLRGGGC